MNIKLELRAGRRSNTGNRSEVMIPALFIWTISLVMIIAGGYAYKTNSSDGDVIFAMSLVSAMMFTLLGFAIFISRNDDNGPSFENQCAKLGGTVAYEQHGKSQDGFCIVNNRVVKRD